MKNIVIGSGPAGRLGSLELGKLGEEVTLIEKNHIAGTCLNEGCMVICALTDITKFIENNNKKPSTKVIKAPIKFTFSSSLKNQVDIKKEGIVKMQRLTTVEERVLKNNCVCNSIGLSKSHIILPFFIFSST